MGMAMGSRVWEGEGGGVYGMRRRCGQTQHMTERHGSRESGPHNNPHGTWEAVLGLTAIVRKATWGTA